MTPILRELATGGEEFIIAQASGYNTAAPDVSLQTDVPSLIWDNPEAAEPGLVANAEAQGQGGGYLAGVLAAETSKTGTLGIVISADDTNWNRMAGGFVKGAQSVNPDIEIRLAQIGQAGYADTAGGKRVTEQVIADGADVIFGMGDGSSFGMIQAVEAADGVMFIDVIGDKTKIDKQGILLSSVLWNFDVLFNQALDDLDGRDVRRDELRARPGQQGHLAAPDRADRRRCVAGRREGSRGDRERRRQGAGDDQEVAGGGPHLRRVTRCRVGGPGARGSPGPAFASKGLTCNRAPIIASSNCGGSRRRFRVSWRTIASTSTSTPARYTPSWARTAPASRR